MDRFAYLHGCSACARRGLGHGRGRSRRRAGGLARGADRSRLEARHRLQAEDAERRGGGGHGRGAGLVVARQRAEIRRGGRPPRGLIVSWKRAQEGLMGLGRCQSSAGIRVNKRLVDQTDGYITSSYPWRAATATMIDA